MAIGTKDWDVQEKLAKNALMSRWSFEGERRFMQTVASSKSFEEVVARTVTGSGRDDTVVIVDAPSTGSIFPTPIVVAAVFGRTLQLLFGDAGPVAAKAGIVLEGLPR